MKAENRREERRRVNKENGFALLFMASKEILCLTVFLEYQLNFQISSLEIAIKISGIER